MPVDYHKHLSFTLDSKMSCSKHIDGKIAKANQGVSVIKRLYNYLLRKSLFRGVFRPGCVYRYNPVSIPFLYFTSELPVVHRTFHPNMLIKVSTNIPTRH